MPNRLSQNFTHDEAVQIRIALLNRETHLDALIDGAENPDPKLVAMRRLVTRLLDELAVRPFDGVIA